MSNKIELLKILSTPKSLECLAQTLGLSKFVTESIISSINNIEKDLVKQNSLGKFFLSRKIDWLDINKINVSLSSYNLKYQVLILGEVTSTNSYIMEKIDTYPNRSVIIAEYQSLGRGRGNKIWISRIARDITLSIVYWFNLNFIYELLPLIIAVAVNRTLKNFMIRTRIKWPNDILLEGESKVGGILVEGGIKNNMRYAVLGIGLDNLNDIDRNLLLVDLIKSLENILSEYPLVGFSLLKQEWLANCIHYHKNVQIFKSGVQIDTGTNIGISDKGALLVKNGETIIEYSSANISLRWC